MLRIYYATGSTPQRPILLDLSRFPRYISQRASKGKTEGQLETISQLSNEA